MAATRSDRNEVQQAIGAHLASNGDGWDQVRQRFPEVPVATFWRWVRDVKAKPSKLQIDAARMLLSGVPGALTNGTAPLPAPVPCTALTEGGARALTKINFMREFELLMLDAKLLRDFALTADRGTIETPKVFVESAKLRIQLLSMWLTALPVLYSAERSQELHAAIIEAISACDPTAQSRILESLRAIKDRAGFVTHVPESQPVDPCLVGGG